MVIFVATSELIFTFLPITYAESGFSDEKEPNLQFTHQLRKYVRYHK
jgi:hypothetical protein